MEDEREGAVWIASYPKSGNTWLRCLLEAYRRNGILDINDIRITSSDGGATIIQGVSPVSLDELGFRGEMLVRPAALVNLFARLTKPLLIKTHFANMQPVGLPPCIPPEFTERAIYILRDPRAVFLSFSRYFDMPFDVTADAMSSIEFVVGGKHPHASTFISSWSNHVASWLGEKTFPVHAVKYEDMAENPEKELKAVLEFMGITVDESIVKLAADAASFNKLKAIEIKDGFFENSHSKASSFFNGGPSWKEELEEKWIARIEKDHGKIMKSVGYL